MIIDPTIIVLATSGYCFFIALNTNLRFIRKLSGIFEARSIKIGILKGPKNMALYILLAFVFGILFLITIWDVAQIYLVIITLSWQDWLIAFGASLIVLIVSEIYKRI